MNKLSIFSLIKLNNDTKTEQELLQRYNDYKDSPSLICKKTNIKHFFKTIQTYLSNEKLIDIDELELLSQKINISSFEDYEDELFSLAKNSFYIEIIKFALKECKSFYCAYLSLFLANFIPYNEKNKEFNEIIKIYSSSIFFSYISISILQKSKEYPLLHHQAYYSFIDSNNRSLNFYLNYPNEYDSSLYYKLLNNYPVQNSHTPLSITPINDKSNNEFISLIRKHNNALTTFQQIKDFINDFDDHFSRNTNIFNLVNTFKNEISNNLDDYPYLVDFILTLLTRCQLITTLAFAITCLDFLVYSNKFNRLYKDIEYLAQYESISLYCILSLQKNKNFQAILRRLFKLNSVYLITPIMNYLDFSNKLNFKIVVNSLDNPLIQNVFIDQIFTNCQLDKLMNEPSLSKQDINLIAKFISYYCYYGSQQNIISYYNIYSLIENFYKKYYFYIDSNHFFNVALLTVFDEQNEFKNTKNLILSNMIFEDELTYIDEQLTKNDFNIEEISMMIEYFDYNINDKIIELLKSNPLRYIKFLTIINDQSFIENCLSIIDEYISIEKNHLIIDNSISDYTISTLKEEANLGILSNILENIPICYNNIYKIGINYFRKEIRILFYENLVNNLSFNIIDYELLKQIENNAYLETDDQISEMINKILNYKSIQIS